MRGGLRTMERVLHGETQGGHTGRAWRIRLAGKTGGTKRHGFQQVAQTKTHRSETTTVGSLLRCVHTIQIKLRGRQGRRDLLWCASIRIGLAWLRPESRERRVQFALWWHHLSHTNTHSNIQIALGVRVASKCYARAPPLRHVYTVGKKQYLCSTIGIFEETINFNAHCTTDWSAASATKGVWVWSGCMNKLHKDHINVVQGYKSYQCPIKFNNIYMFFKDICMLFKKKICSLRNIICRIRNINMSDKP